MHKTNVKVGCEWLADRYGWNLAPRSVMVEGTSDVAYFKCAAERYERDKGKKLIGDDFTVFAAGLGEEGGTYGISERFPNLFHTASLDIDGAGRLKYRVIALVDDDAMGRSAVMSIVRGNRSIIEFDSIFRLRRVMPMGVASTKFLSQATATGNAEFENLDCLIEDLLAAELLTRFEELAPQAIRRPPMKRGPGSHRYFTEDGKRALLGYTKQEATLQDLSGIVDTLRALRSYLGLAADGV